MEPTSPGSAVPTKRQLQETAKTDVVKSRKRLKAGPNSASEAHGPGGTGETPSQVKQDGSHSCAAQRSSSNPLIDEAMDATRRDALRDLARFVTSAWPDTPIHIRDLLHPNRPEAHELAASCAEAVGRVLGLAGNHSLFAASPASHLFATAPAEQLATSRAKPAAKPAIAEPEGDDMDDDVVAFGVAGGREGGGDVYVRPVSQELERDPIENRFSPGLASRRTSSFTELEDDPQHRKDIHVFHVSLRAVDASRRLAPVGKPIRNPIAYSHMLQRLPAFNHPQTPARGFQEIFLDLHKKSGLFFSRPGKHASTRPLLPDRSIEATNGLEAKLKGRQISISSVMEMAERRAVNEEEGIRLRYEEAMVLDILEANTDSHVKKSVNEQLLTYMTLQNKKAPNKSQVALEKSLLVRLGVLRKVPEHRWIVFFRNPSLNRSLKRISAKDLPRDGLKQWAEFYTNVFDQLSNRWRRMSKQLSCAPDEYGRIEWYSRWAAPAAAYKYHKQYRAVVKRHTLAASMEQLAVNGGFRGDSKLDFAWSIATVDNGTQPVCVTAVSVPLGAFLGVLSGHVGYGPIPIDLDEELLITGPNDLWLKRKRCRFDHLMRSSIDARANVDFGWEAFHDWKGRYVGFCIMVFASDQIPAFEPLRF